MQAWGVSFIETTIQDLHCAARGLLKRPAFTAAVVLSLALGIGANTAIFTLMDAVMWRALPLSDPDRLVVVGRRVGDTTESGFTFGQFRMMRDQATLARLAGYAHAPLNIAVDGPPEASVPGVLVTGQYFAVVGVSAARGRVIQPDDDQIVNGHPVVVLSDGYWQRRFARDPAVVGRIIRISGTPFTVIGIAPAGFFGVEIGAAPDLFVPMTMQPTVMPAFENLLENPIVMRAWVQVVARLEREIWADRAGSELERLLRPDDEQRIQASKGRVAPTSIALVQAGTTSSLRRQFSQPLVVLSAIVGIVLLIACANAANLLLARAATRQTEFAMRAALGASRGRLVRQLLTESVLLAVSAGAVGVLVAYWATRLLVTYISVGRAPIVLDTAPNLRVLLFTLMASILTGTLFGLAPAWRATDLNLVQTLSALRGSFTRRLRVDRLLSAAQISLSLVLLAGAGLFVRSVVALGGGDRGDVRQRIVMVRVEPRGSDQRNIPGASERLDRAYRELIERTRQIPGVTSVSMANGVPTSPTSSSAVQITPPGAPPIRVPSLMVYPDYFRTIGIRVLAGREFGSSDLAEEAPAVCIVNESYVRQFLGGQDAIGKPCYTGVRARLVRFGDSSPTMPREAFSIVGVVEDSRYSNPRGETLPLIYQTFLQANTGRGQMVLHLRAAAAVGEIVQRVRQEVARLDPAMPMFDVHTLEEEMQAALVQQRLIATLASFFGALSVLLACVGLYGLFAFMVAQRHAEIGVRMAVGARREQVRWLVLRDAMRLILLGVAIGVPAALAAGRLAANRIAGLLFGLEATDPATIAGAALLLMLVAGCAVLLPAWHATRVDPLTVLRST